MRTPCLLSVAIIVILASSTALSGQVPTTGTPVPSSPSPAGPIAAPVGAASSAASVSVASTASASVTPALKIEPKAAVESVLAMFNINPAVNVEPTGKPLPATGSWGAQLQFPAGPPKVCAQAHVPCLKVLYRVPEDKIVCEWTLGYVTAVEPQPDGTVRHATHQVVLDENDAAARYTLKIGWGRGEARPNPTFYRQPDYPTMARNANVGGAVAVRLVVGPDGLVKNVVAVGPKLLQPAVIQAVQQWKFDPLSIGQQPTSFQIDTQFNYNAAKPNMTAGMDPSGQVMLQEADPHLQQGFRSNGASTGGWSSCNSAGCSIASPETPK